MTINFNVKVTSGKKTEIQVGCYGTSVNEKFLEFKDSKKTISENKIAAFIEKSVKEALEKYKSEA